MTGCTEFPSPCEAIQKHLSGPRGPSGQGQHWMEHQACVQTLPGLVLSPIPWFCLGNLTTASPLGLLTRK